MFKSTHEVINQSLPLINYNVYKSDKSLQRILKKLLDKSTYNNISNYLSNYGKTIGSEEMLTHADIAEKNKPILKQYDSYGRRIDIVNYHPSYHIIMKNGLSIGSASYGYNNHYIGSHITRGALIYMENQFEPGHCCPLVMTSAAIPVLKKLSNVLPDVWLNKILVQDYDSSNQPIDLKSSITIGMSMTEKQGGSDVRANTTVAKPLDSSTIQPGKTYALTGHKWFTSAPMSDGFLTLAQLEGSNSNAPSCFLVPRYLPDGRRNNGFQIVQLKDKCADRANASSEIEYNNCFAILLSDHGKGVRTIIDMVQSTRMDCALGSAGGMKKALHIAINHTNQRLVNNKKLSTYPLMLNLLTDLTIESEANTVTSLYISHLYDLYQKSLVNKIDSNTDSSELFRIAVSVAKYYITKRQPNFVFECMEIFGGNGFIEEFPMAKLFRHSPLNSIWEGSGNVISLDILKALKSLPVLMSDIKLCYGSNSHLDRYINKLDTYIDKLLVNDDIKPNEQIARYLADYLGIALQGSLLVRYSDPLIAEGFIESRITREISGLTYGSTIYQNNHIYDILNENLIEFY